MYGKQYSANKNEINSCKMLDLNQNFKKMHINNNLVVDILSEK